eukprot:PhF_6_TR6077/c0_g1_i1/m.8855/K19191/mabO; 4-methylaminobutanoate oxidase (formaldehyde-forming)
MFPTTARAVVIGGGVIGCSVAYHLAAMGWKDVVLLERDKLTSGTTWHAAGLMAKFGSLSDTSTEMRKYTQDLYDRLEAETGQSTGFKRVGFIELAPGKDWREYYRRVTAFNRYMGVDVEEIGPDDIKRLFPLCDVEDVLCGFYVKDDGRANPVDVTMALAKGAKKRGVQVLEQTPATGIVKQNGRAVGVNTDKGTILCEHVVNCSGMWARQLGKQVGVHVPLQAAEHYYLITEPIAGVSSSWPVVEDPSRYGYYREEGGGIMVGLFEPYGAAWNVKGIPKDSSFTSLQPDWGRMTGYLSTAMSRIPATTSAGVKTFFCGPESFTPDMKPIVGESPELKNYWVAAGLNSIGILTGGGMGRLLAHWMINGRADCDITGINVDRTQKYQINPEFLKERVVESLGHVYALHYPHLPTLTARNARFTPFYERLKARGAFFRDVSGWEGADWYAPKGVDPKTLAEPLSWGKHKWFPLWEAEHKAVREGVIVMDMSFMCKYIVQGRDAGAVLNWISANNVNGEEGRITYTQWLSAEGTMEADLTVTKLSEDKFLVIATDTAQRHVESWFNRNKDPNALCTMTDVTSGYAQLNIQGPKSRELMQALTSEDMSNEAFPFRCAREIDIGFARVLCVRITYLGELGYELFIPCEHALQTYDRIVEVGEKNHGLVHAGLKALGSCRMEKGYKDFGHDMDNCDSVIDVGLGFAVDMKKPGGFLGKEAVAAHRSTKKAFLKRVVHVKLENPDVVLYHGEILYRNGKPCGYVRASSYGHTVGSAVALAGMNGDGSVIDKAMVEGSKWELDVAGTRYPVVVSLRPFYDPDNLRIKM